MDVNNYFKLFTKKIKRVYRIIIEELNSYKIHDHLMPFEPGNNASSTAIKLKGAKPHIISNINKLKSWTLVDKYTPKAVAELCKLISVGDARVRIRAIELLLAYGLGKPKETVQITGADGADLMPSITINVGSARTEISDALGNVVDVQPPVLVPENNTSREVETIIGLNDDE